MYWRCERDTGAARNGASAGSSMVISGQGGDFEARLLVAIMDQRVENLASDPDSAAPVALLEKRRRDEARRELGAHVAARASANGNEGGIGARTRHDRHAAVHAMFRTGKDPAKAGWTGDDGQHRPAIGTGAVAGGARSAAR